MSGETHKGKPVIVANVASGPFMFTNSVGSEQDMARWSGLSVKRFILVSSGILLSTEGCGAMCM